MKRTALLFATMFGMVLAAGPAFAQGGQDYITLTDSTPSIDVVVAQTPGTTGVVGLEMVEAAVLMLDVNGLPVFQGADGRVHQLELRLAPTADTYTLSAERLSGASQSYVRVMSQPALTEPDLTFAVSQSQEPLTLYQSTDLTLNANTPSQVIDVTIADGTTGTVEVSFPGAAVGVDVSDSNGQTVASLGAGAIDGMSLVLDGGTYRLTLVSAQIEQQTSANVSVMSALPSTLDSLALAVDTQPVAQPDSQVATDTTAAVADTNTVCVFSVEATAVNLRSGPGEGYSVLGVGVNSEQFQVGGANADGTWVLVGAADGSATWVARSTGTLQGDCQGLAVYDIPSLNAPDSQVTVSQPGPFRFDEDEHEGFEGHEDHGFEHDD
ncbi:SH3 domain-containing protein [Aggregatilinea lenta]|uniref:SH3 domain-containing protein n=1 Tax=Aggregatilinea lenta TaxID=913108 RepID=UPI000E5BA0BA|nr:SH3 domain-containing protein [Aggregatilinea lenta]